MSKTDLSQLKPAEARALVVLMTHAGGPLRNAELMELGAGLKSEHHRHLTELGLITVTKVGQANAFELTEDGWQALREPHASDPAVGAGRFILGLLRALQLGLDRRRISHGEFFEPGADVVPPQRIGDDEVQAQIRAAYARLPKAPGGWVGLADLREELADLSRATVDKALRKLARQADVRIVPVDNRKALTDRDRRAALRIGEDDVNVIAMGVR